MTPQEIQCIETLRRSIALGVIVDIIGTLAQAVLQLELAVSDGGEKKSPVSHELRERLEQYCEVKR